MVPLRTKLGIMPRRGLSRLSAAGLATSVFTKALVAKLYASGLHAIALWRREMTISTLLQQ